MVVLPELSYEAGVSYPATVEYLYALGNELKAGARFGLDRMRTLMEALGHPEDTQRIVHVAGTNGKGSTCVMISSVLQEAGLRTGLNTSPHLIEPTERIQVDGNPISREDFEAAFNLVHTVAEKLIREERIDDHPSYFETITAMALCVFRERSEMSVLEVGLGGRLDATNIANPQLTVITPVSFDHEAFLGNTLESIASEKAGILKPNVTLVLAPQHPAAERVILARAKELNCPVVGVDMEAVSQLEVTPRRSIFSLKGLRYECPLPGRHQLQNAVTAVVACQELGITGEIIRRGLGKAVWPGRLEYLSTAPDFILDGAHNPAGAAALASYIREFCAGRPVWLVYGAMRDKAIDEVTSQLFPLAEKLIATKPDFPRALRLETILAAADHPNAVATESVAEAIRVARTAPPSAAVFFTGSLYLVGEVRKLLRPSKMASE
jgi:dihydrofolate synthase/folylpolyglutamate synthase